MNEEHQHIELMKELVRIKIQDSKVCPRCGNKLKGMHMPDHPVLLRFRCSKRLETDCKYLVNVYIHGLSVIENIEDKPWSGIDSIPLESWMRMPCQIENS